MDAFVLPSLTATQGMASLSVVIFVIELLSLLLFALCTFEFFQLIRRHAALFDAIGIPRQRSTTEWRAWVMFIIYACVTLLITVVSLFLFVVQPHWF